MIQFTGTIKKIGAEFSGTSKSGQPYETQLVVVHIDDSEYPYDIAATGFGKVLDQIALFQEGVKVTINTSMKSVEFKDKWFTNVNLHSIMLANGEDINAGTDTGNTMQPNKSFEDVNENDQLPF